MYCVHCGVQLADSEKVCPLCGTRVCHPDLAVGEGEHLYPGKRYPTPEPKPWGVQLIISVAMLIPILSVLSIDLQTNGDVTWSGYVIGVLLLGYVMFVLPFWFRDPNPVIFVPIGFVGIGVYLLYISLASGGGWFLSFAFPVTGFVGLLVTAVVTLIRYVKRGKLYIFGGASLAFAAFMPLMEFLLNYTFYLPRFVWWSLYPVIIFGLLGATLIFLAICRPARESIERRIFT